jgi:hypothetical protein
MRKRSAARLSRALLVLPVAAVSQQLLANTGVQLPLSQYSGNETTTVVPNGNFNDRGVVDGNGNYPAPTGWAGFGDIYAGPPAFTNPSYAAQINPFAAVVRPADTSIPTNVTGANNILTHNYGSPASLTPNGNYVLSAYIWNDGIPDLSGFGSGDLATVKIVDPESATFNNVSITVEGNGADGQDAGTGRFAYLMFNESQVRNWSGIDVIATADFGTTSGARPQTWAQFDNIAITPIETFLGQKFTGASGSWGDSTKWAGGVVPNVKGAIASFTTANSPTTVTVDAATTVGAVTLGGTGGYTLGGGSELRLKVSEDGFHQFQGIPTVHVLSGDHTITAPLVFDATPDDGHAAQPFSGAFNVAAGSSVTATNVTADNIVMSKYGAGTATVDKMRAKSLNVVAGTLKIAQNSTATGVSKVETLTVAPGAKFDLTDNKLITNDAAGTENAGVYSGVQGMVQSARAGGTWTGSGLTTSLPAAATGLTSIGVATGAQLKGLTGDATATFAGQTINAASTVAMYTYAGDANMDGFISGDDYSAIDFNIAIAGADGWVNGDFNYDGIISGDDYSAIDFNIVAQGTPFPTSGGIAGVTAVPEPTWLGVGAITLLALRRRSRRAE